MRYLLAFALIALTVAGAVLFRSRTAKRIALGAVPKTEEESALLVTEPETLRTLEHLGLTFAQVMGASGASGKELESSDFYRIIAGTVRDDVTARHDSDPRSSYASESRATGEAGAVKPRHLFDPTWLTSDHSEFELVGVVNRLDRALMEPDTCGETRLVYRLALTPPGRPTTRLPMTVNVRFTQPRDASACRSIAQSWIDVPASSRRDGLATALLTGPLRSLHEAVSKASGANRTAFDKVEIDFQLIHEEPHAVGTDDHSEYVLRGFQRGIAGEAALTPEPLIDTPANALDSVALAKLGRWIGENLSAIDEGNVIIPQDVLGPVQTRAASFAPRGLGRPENRPFLNLFQNPETSFGALFRNGESTSNEGLTANRSQRFSQINATGGKTLAAGSMSQGAERATKLVHSPAALVRRLDQMTCTGCHATRSIAGFHLVGDERDPRASLGALFGGRSQHLTEDLTWRRRYLALVAASEAGQADRHAEPRPFPEHEVSEDGRPDERAPGGYGAHCGVPEDKDQTYSRWTCKSGLVCRRVNLDDEVGACTTERAGPGDSCELSRRRPEHDDQPAIVTKRGAARSCEPPSAMKPPEFVSGCFSNRSFPGGMCSVEESCLANDPKAPCPLTEPTAHIVPGRLYGSENDVNMSIGLLGPRNHQKDDCANVDLPLEVCMSRAENQARALAQACDANRPCRDDFTCVRVEDEQGGKPAVVGACAPPYFVFQLRVDGPRLDRL